MLNYTFEKKENKMIIHSLKNLDTLDDIEDSYENFLEILDD